MISITSVWKVSYENIIFVYIFTIFFLRYDIENCGVHVMNVQKQTKMTVTVTLGNHPLCLYTRGRGKRGLLLQQNFFALFVKRYE